MVAYNFQSRFAGKVASRDKCQTIRAPRQRHARPGERVQLYTGMRTKGCRKLVDPDPVCLSVHDVSFWWTDNGQSIILDGSFFSLHEMTQFAQQDGFATLDAFYEFFEPQMALGCFRGVLIRWDGAKPARRGA